MRIGWVPAPDAPVPWARTEPCPPRDRPRFDHPCPVQQGLESMRKPVVIAIATFVTAALVDHAVRAQFVWNGSKNNDWNDKANWNGGAAFPDAAGARRPSDQDGAGKPDPGRDQHVHGKHPCRRRSAEGHRGRHLGTGAGTTRVASGATLNIDNVAYKTAQPVSLRVGSTLSGKGTASFAGPITIQPSGTPRSRVTLSVPGNGTLTQSGAIGQSVNGANSTTLFKTGSGTLVLASANTFSSALTIAAGVVKVTTNNAARHHDGQNVRGPGSHRRKPASERRDVDVLQCRLYDSRVGGGPGAGSRGLAINNDAGTSSFAGPIALQVNPGAGGAAANSEFGAAKGTTLTLTGVISGKGQGLTKVGDGTIILSPGAAGGNTYSGGTTIQAGTLIVTANSALGPGTGGTTIVSGGLLGFQGGVNYTTTEAVKVAGTNFGDGPTAITSLGGTNAFAGPITLQGSTDQRRRRGQVDAHPERRDQPGRRELEAVEGRRGDARADGRQHVYRRHRDQGGTARGREQLRPRHTRG